MFRKIAESMEKALHGIYIILKSPNDRERLEQICLQLAVMMPEEEIQVHVEEELRPDLIHGMFKSSLVFFEVDDDNIEASNHKIHAFQKAAEGNPFQMVLFCHSNYNYFQLAEKFEIGNLILDHQFDLPLIRAIARKLLFDRLFGYDSFFPDALSFNEKYVFSGEVDRESLFEKPLSEFGGRLDESEASHFKTVLQELLLNALDYGILGITPEDRDEHGARGPRHTLIPENKPIGLRILQDDEKWGAVVSDLSGALGLKRILHKFQRHVVTPGSDEIPPGLLDGTGRGLFILSRSNRLVINVLRQIKTEIIVLHYKNADLNKYQPLIVNERTPQYELRSRGYITL
jgi:hypothetical protein